MTEKEAISKIIEALELMTKRIKKIEKDVLRLCCVWPGISTGPQAASHKLQAASSKQQA